MVARCLRARTSARLRSSPIPRQPRVKCATRPTPRKSLVAGCNTAHRPRADWNGAAKAERCDKHANAANRDNALLNTPLIMFEARRI